MRIKITSHQREKSYFISAAMVEWEDCQKVAYPLFFAIPERLSGLVSDRFDHFIVAVVAIALAYGESRVYIDADVSASLLQNLKDFEYLQRYYFGDRRSPLKIEARSVVGFRNAKPGTASLLTGGVDSLFTLYNNHQHFFLNDRNRISHAIFSVRDAHVSSSDHVQLDELLKMESRIIPFCDESGIVSVPVITNDGGLRPINDWYFWGDRGHGAGFASTAHLLSGGIGKLYIPSTELDLRRNCWGSTVATDQFLGSDGLHVVHDGVRHSRRDKLQAIIDRPLVRKLVKVCFHRPPDRINCGVCEKCLRTRLILLTLGQLDNVKAFVKEPIDPSLFDGRATRDADLIDFYDHISLELQALGWVDLANATRGFSERSRMTISGNGEWELFW